MRWRRRDAAETGGPTRPAPAVSVVVPFWNVERYLAECLDSLLAQTFTDYEVLLVDDGSPDGSRAIADEHAARDPRFRVVERTNGGLGAARNTGVREARGEWLTFVDSDDVLPPRALEALLAAGEGPGAEPADVVVGAVDRVGPEGRWIPPWVDEVHAEDLRGVRLAEVPGLLRNLYTWNKLYRRAFWDAQGQWFREGVSYEDQPLVTLLLARAVRIDVLTETVYTWRLRDDESSISQQKAGRRDLGDRVAAWRASREALRDALSPDLHDAWLTTILDVQAQWYLAGPGVEDDGFWADLVDGVRDLLGDAPPAVWAAAQPAHRVLARLALDDRRDDARAFVAAGGTHQERFPAAVTERGLDLVLPLRDDPALADDLFLLRPEQARVRHLVERVRWLDDHTLRVEGWAFLRHVDLGAGGATQRVTVSLRGPRVGVEALSDAEPPAAMPPPVDAEAWADHRPGRFGATLDLSDQLPGTRTLWLRVEAAGLVAECPVTRVVRAGGGALLPRARWRWGQPFRIDVDGGPLPPGPARAPRAADGVVVDSPDDLEGVARPAEMGDHALSAPDGRPLLVGPGLLPLLPMALDPDGGGDAWRAGRLVRGPGGRLRLVRPAT